MQEFFSHQEIFKELEGYNFRFLTEKDKARFVKWLKGKDGADQNTIKSRGQAVDAYPLLAYKIYDEKEIREAVEQKKPLAPALAEYYKVDEKRLKRVQGKSRADLGIESRDHIYNIIALKERYFQQLKNNLSDLKIFRKHGSHIYNFSLNEFLDYLSLRSGHPRQYIERMKEHSVLDVRDAFNFLLKKLFIPAFLNRIKNHAQKNNLTWHHQDEYWYINKELLIKHTNFKTILDFSERYHRNLFRWEDMFNFDSKIDFISWKPLFDKIDLGDGWEVRELHSIASLKEQGRRENHCVGGYAGSILKRGDDSARLILSLEKEGEVKSTIDMLCSKNEEKNRLDVKIQQNRAHSNKNPSREALNFSHHLFEIIKKQPISKLDAYLHNLKDAKEEYQKYKSENEYIEECGYNPWDREILENVWDEFKPILPKKLRRGGLDGLIEMMPLYDFDFRPRKKYHPPNPWDEIANKKQDQRDHVENDM